MYYIIYDHALAFPKVATEEREGKKWAISFNTKEEAEAYLDSNFPEGQCAAIVKVDETYDLD
jgi:hypothetical protein